MQWEDTFRQMKQPQNKTDFLPKFDLNVSYDNLRRDFLTVKTVYLKVYFDMEHCVQKKNLKIIKRT